MKHRLQVTNDNWSYTSYNRQTFRWDIVYTVMQYKEMNALYNLNIGKLHIRDGFVERMLHDRLITSDMKHAYEVCVLHAFEPLTRFDDCCIEDIYGVLHQERKKCFGAELIEKAQELMAQTEKVFEIKGGIDQTKKKEALFESCRSAIFILTDPTLFSLMKKDLEEAMRCGKTVYVVVGEEAGEVIPSVRLMKTLCGQPGEIRYLTMECRNHGLNFEGISWDEELQKQIDCEETFFLIYGEEGLLSCKELLVQSIVYGVPTGYFTRSLTNQHAVDRACIVYIPKNFDITRWVPIWGKTRISYWQMFRLWEQYGDQIYDLTPKQLYQMYPQSFLNIYSDQKTDAEGMESYPIQLAWDQVPDEEEILWKYDRFREQAISDYLNANENIVYKSAYFDEAMQMKEIPWHLENQQTGIMVQAVKVGKVKDSFVVNCDGTPIRDLMRAQKRESNLCIVSNFLFFLTPRLAMLYNELRKDQKRQQIDFQGGHLDYMLYYEGDRRVETFPLLNKACIGMTDQGEYRFFRFQLGAGEVTINGETIRWEKEAVNTECPKAAAVYTPLYVKDLESEEPKKFKMQIGDDRINIVMIQEKLICIRKGPVYLSSAGVVISMEESAGEAFLEKIGAKPVEDGYFECESCDICVKLDPPEHVRDWEHFRWIYGGGLSLMLDGKDPCADGEDALVSWISEEGWLTILSRQTQESAIEKLAKHPRTGVGVTKDGDLVILVYAGRIKKSVGADYCEMVQIAKAMFPDLTNLMNVDGGASAFLGMSIGNSFMELSFPATSANNCAGMVRPVNTILCLEP